MKRGPWAGFRQRRSAVDTVVNIMGMLEMSGNMCFKAYILHESKGLLFSLVEGIVQQQPACGDNESGSDTSFELPPSPAQHGLTDYQCSVLTAASLINL